MKKSFFLLLIPALFIWGCSHAVNTSTFSSDEYYNYAMQLFNDESYEEAIQAFQTIVLQFPGSKVIGSSQYYLGESHFKRKEYILAAYEFSRLMKDMPANENVPKAQYMLAESYYQLSPNFQLDQKYTKKSIEEFQAFIDLFPTDAKVPEAEQKIKDLNTKLAQKEYNAAYIYEKLEYHDAAVASCNIVLDTYHDTKFAPLASLKKIKILIVKGDKKAANRECASFIEKFSKDENLDEVKRMQATLN